MTGVSEGEQRDYQEFAKALLQRFLRPTPPILWHYTTGEALIAIVRSGALWATQVACLNDSSELLYGMRLARDAMAECAARNSDVAHMMGLGAAILADEKAIASEWFVSCLTERRDDLSQWRAYGGGEGGYAIGFEAASLLGAGAPDRSFLGPVSYDHAANMKLTRDIAAGMVRHFRAGLANDERRVPARWVQDFLASWDAAMTPLAPMLKDPAFSSEMEWRIIRRITTADAACMKYRQKPSMMVRHLPLRFPSLGGLETLPIVEIMVGPCRHIQTSVASVSALLRSHRYPPDKTRVTMSRTPFQSG